MAKARVIQLKAHDPALEEEARIAATIVDRLSAGDEQARTELFERYGPGLLRLLTQRIGDKERAQDLLHDTFCIAFKKLAEVDIEYPERLAGYLRGIAVRVAFSEQRRDRRDPVPVDSNVVDAIQDIRPRQFESVSVDETKAAVMKLLDSMPVNRDRQLLIRLYVYEQDRSEICEALELDRLHFNRILHRAKGRFRKIVEKSQLLSGE